MKERFRKMKSYFDCFIEKQGFPIIATICVAVITATALFTRKNDASYVSPTPPPSEHVSAAQLLQQSLSSAVRLTPTPTTEPSQWCSPLEEGEIVRPFHAQEMVSYDSGIWAVHDAIDIKASSGAKVRAIGDGEVSDAGDDPLNGAWLTIIHPDGITAHYAGLALINDYIPGDAVRKGDIIGFLGNTKLDEASIGPHLHLRTAKDGIALNPTSLWEDANHQK